MKTFGTNDTDTNAMSCVQQFSEVGATLSVDFFKIYDWIIHSTLVVFNSHRNRVIINERVYGVRRAAEPHDHMCYGLNVIAFMVLVGACFHCFEVSGH